MALPLFIRISGSATDSRMSRDVLFCTIAFIFTTLFYKGLYRVKYKNLYFIFFVLLLIHSWAIQWNQVSFEVIWQWLCIGCFSILTLTFISRAQEINAKLVFNLLLVVGIIQSLWITAEYFGINTYAQVLDYLYPGKFVRVNSFGIIIKENAIAGSMGNSNLTASVIAICFPVLSIIKNNYIKYGCFAILMCGLVVCDSLMGYATAYVAIMLIFTSRKYYKTAFVMAICSVGAFLSLYPDTFKVISSGRYDVWQKSFEYFGRIDVIKLLFGQGVGFFADNFGAINGVTYKQVHNEFIESVYAFGLLGTGLILVVLSWVIYNSKNILASVIILSMCVNMFGHFTLHVSTTAFIFSLLIAICINGKEDI